MLIATGNSGKFQEFITEFADLKIKFVNLRDLKLDKIDLEEPYDTTWENAVHKARFFARKTGLITISEDTAFHIDYLGGAPGVHVKRAAPTAAERLVKIITALKGVPQSKRGAEFFTSACVYNPQDDSFSIFSGKIRGLIADRINAAHREGMEHDSIFYYPPLKKMFCELTPIEKNLVSHRGQIVRQIKFFLSKQYQPRQLIVPVALVVKNKKMLLLRRRDFRPGFNGAWEFPGGGVEYGEDIIACLKRETKEETGFVVEVIDHLPRILTIMNNEKAGDYQVFLDLYICRPTSGKLKVADHETSAAKWCSLAEIKKLRLLPLNRRSLFCPQNYKIIKKYFS